MSKVVFITGGGTGIGAATARVLHKKGATVALFDVNAETLKNVKTELGERCLTFVGDVCEMSDLEDAIAKTVETYGKLDAVFANAGIARVAPMVSFSEEEWLKVFDVNLHGVWRTLKAATPYLLTSKGYALVTSSASSSICVPLLAPYTATKSGVLNMAEAYRTEMCGHGIEVGTLHPMFVKTAMVEDAVWNNPYGYRLTQQSKIMFLNFPLSWAAKRAAKMILRRKRRATVPIVHLPVVWFPRFANDLVSLIAFRRRGMRKMMEDLPGEHLVRR